MLNTCFPSESLEFWTLRNISRVLLRFMAGGIKRILCDSTERTLGSLYPLPSDIPHMPPPFADLALYPSASINLSWEYDYMLSHASPLRDSSNLGGGLGSPMHTHLGIVTFPWRSLSLWSAPLFLGIFFTLKSTFYATSTDAKLSLLSMYMVYIFPPLYLQPVYVFMLKVHFFVNNI